MQSFVIKFRRRRLEGEGTARFAERLFKKVTRDFDTFDQAARWVAATLEKTDEATKLQISSINISAGRE